jgi:glutaredoxin-like YruB-family protein
MTVTVFTTPSCPWCRRAKEFLSQRGVPFVERDVAADPVASAEMIQRSGQQGVPVLLFGDEVVVGFDRPRIERLLADRPRKRRPTFGAAIADAASYLAKRGQVPIFGAFVGKVSPGSPAQRIGLEPGDIITQIGLRPITNADGVEQAIEALEPGARAHVTFTRGNRQVTREAAFQ